MPRVIAVVLTLGLTLYAVIDCIQTPQPRALPKALWLLIIVIAPILGPLLWILFGRINGGGGGGGDDDQPLAPDDDPSFLTFIA